MERNCTSEDLTKNIKTIWIRIIMARGSRDLLSHDYMFFQFCLVLSLAFKSNAFPTNRAFLTGPRQDKSYQYPVPLRLGIGESIVDNTDDDFSRNAALTSTSAALDWSFLDAVYLIHCPNADINGERIKSTKGIFDEVNLLDSVVVKEFETDDDDRVRGCYTSHVSVFRDILENRQSSGLSNNFNIFDVFQKQTDPFDDKNVLIFEDNVNLGNKNLEQNTIVSKNQSQKTGIAVETVCKSRHSKNVSEIIFENQFNLQTSLETLFSANGIHKSSKTKPQN